MLFVLVKTSLNFSQYKPCVDNLTGLLFSWKGDTVTKYDGNRNLHDIQKRRMV